MRRSNAPGRSCQANASSAPTGSVTLRSITSLVPAIVAASL